MLEAFEGKISLTEILSLDTNRLFGLLEAKRKLNEEKAKRAAEQAADLEKDPLLNGT